MPVKNTFPYFSSGRRYGFALCAACILSQAHMFAQQITVSGKVVDRHGYASLSHTMVVNQHSGIGAFANSDGTFSLSLDRNDTLLITARDYQIKKLCFHDSAPKPIYHVKVYLDSLHYELNEVTIRPSPTLRQVHKEINNLGVQNTDTYKTADMESPITMLYERFSRIEQSKRKVAQMEDDDARRKVLKNLFHLYIKYDIINLSDKNFDDFIDYLNINDYFLQHSTDYELVMYIKERYQEYMRDFGTDFYSK